jgi:acetyl esterase/lipase
MRSDIRRLTAKTNPEYSLHVNLYFSFPMKTWTRFFLFVLVTSTFIFDGITKEKESSGNGNPPPTFENVAYGPFKNNVLDFWQAKSDKPTPVVVFIHGGGFVAGDKASSRGNSIIGHCLAAGVSYASINYRFRTEVPIQTILRDCARAIQFLRSKSTEWNIDKTRFASTGGSAGAGTSLWLAFHDDLADPQNSDPVLRESTRLVVAGAGSPQSTYDLVKWKDVLGITQETIDKFSPPEETWMFYGLKSTDEVSGDEGQKIRADCDMLGLISKDDPPVYIHGGLDPIVNGVCANRGQLLHAKNHGLAVKEQCDKIGVTAVIGEEGKNQELENFLFKYLQVTPPAHTTTAPSKEPKESEPK